MIDILIVLAFVIYSISNGLRARAKASENLEEYFLSGRTIKGWRAGISMAATQYSAGTPLLVTGLVASGGIFLIWRLWIYGLAFLMMGLMLGKSWRRSGVLTDAELTEIRYSGRGVLALRGLKAIYYGTLFNCVVLAMVLVAATRISETFLLWDQWLPAGLYQTIYGWIGAVGINLASGVSGLDAQIASTNNVISIAAILTFTTLYSTTGGLRSVVATDVVQLTIAMLATLIYAVIAVRAAGGLGTMSDKLVELYGVSRAGEMLSFSPRGWDAFMPFMMIISLQWFFQMNSDGTGYLAQRTMACRTDRDARIAAVVFTWAQVLVRSLLWLPIAVALLIIYPFDPATAAGETFIAGREILFATGIHDLLPVGVMGLMLTGLLAAMASTIDTHLNWGASYWSNDIYKRIVSEEWLKRSPSSRELVLVARLSNILILGIALVIMSYLDSIQTAWHISLIFGAGMGSVLVLRWFWERINLYSELSAMIASLVIAPILILHPFFAGQEEWLKLLLMSVLSTATVLIVTLLTPPTEERLLTKFYAKVKPSGLWRKTALSAELDPEIPGQEFKVGAVLVLTCGLSVFLLLTGLGKLMIPAPGSTPFLPLGFVLLGLALIPLWWKRAVGGDHEAA